MPLFGPARVRGNSYSTVTCASDDNANDNDHDTSLHMTDFLQRESDVLGEEFGTPTGGTYATAGGDIDFDRAASAVPEISLDGSGDISVPPSAPPLSTSGSFSFDDFSTPPQRATDVKVTGDDEIEKFESEFPDIEVPQVCSMTIFPSSYLTFAPQ